MLSFNDIIAGIVVCVLLLLIYALLTGNNPFSSKKEGFTGGSSVTMRFPIFGKESFVASTPSTSTTPSTSSQQPTKTSNRRTPAISNKNDEDTLAELVFDR